MSLLDGLNPEQRAAVTLPHVSALILAGAGSGKTRVLTTRIAWLIHTGQVSPHGVLAVTFTNKAAREMLARVSAMLPVDPRGMWIGTFHGLAHRLLRAHHREAGLPREFQILDSADQQSVIKRVMKSLNVDDEKFPPRQVAYYINSSKESGLRAAKVETTDFVSRRMNEIYAAYDEQCNREGAVDFAELLLRSYELLETNVSLREHYRNRFRYVLVDEFQDTNLLQYQWLKLFAASQAEEGSAAVFAVGDDDQSIYAFRGANVRNMQDFTRDFGVEHVIKLEQNYRSEANILDAANALISHNRGRLGKNLWTAISGSEPLKLMQTMNDLEEADFVVGQVQDLSERGVALNEMAVFYRSNAQSRVLEHALFRAGIPYRVYGGLRFFERQEIKHALAYLRLIANPDDDGAFLRVVNLPARGIGIRTLDTLSDFARQNRTSLWKAALAKTEVRGRESSVIHPSSLIPSPGSGQALHPSKHPARGVEGFVALIESARAACAGLPLAETIDHVIEASGLQSYYENEKDGKDRVANLDELVNAARGFVAEQNQLSAENLLAEFLAHAALEAGDYQADAGIDALQLMTVHAAKGLEFHSVFITGLEEGLFPHENSLNDPDGVEEERRLMYVALTRGRKRVHLSFAQARMLHGHTRYNIPSRFIREIPDKLIERNVPFEFNRWTSVASATAQEGEAPLSWRVGQNVVHAKFGHGVIVNIEGRGLDARVQVNFREAGVKWLALEYAKLAAL
jgi:DNA helicase II / ATP-dependent DNA helicase PcrA